jgi:hypothetical protein
MRWAVVAIVGLAPLACWRSASVGGAFTLARRCRHSFWLANRIFTVATRAVQAALKQSRLASLEAGQSELRRLPDRQASPELGRSEPLQVGAATQRLETQSPLHAASEQMAWPASQVPASTKIETVLILLVALLVEMGGAGAVP